MTNSNEAIEQEPSSEESGRIDPIVIRKLRMKWNEALKSKLMDDANRVCELLDKVTDLEIKVDGLLSVLKRHHEEALNMPQYKGSPVYLDTIVCLDTIEQLDA
jgi:hypothetical protein